MARWNILAISWSLDLCILVQLANIDILCLECYFWAVVEVLQAQMADGRAFEALNDRDRLCPRIPDESSVVSDRVISEFGAELDGGHFIWNRNVSETLRVIQNKSWRNTTNFKSGHICTTNSPGCRSQIQHKSADNLVQAARLWCYRNTNYIQCSGPAFPSIVRPATEPALPSVFSLTILKQPEETECLERKHHIQEWGYINTMQETKIDIEQNSDKFGLSMDTPSITTVGLLCKLYSLCSSL